MILVHLENQCGANMVGEIRAKTWCNGGVHSWPADSVCSRLNDSSASLALLSSCSRWCTSLESLAVRLSDPKRQWQSSYSDWTSTCLLRLSRFGRLTRAAAPVQGDAVDVPLQLRYGNAGSPAVRLFNMTLDWRPKWTKLRTARPGSNGRKS